MTRTWRGSLVAMTTALLAVAAVGAPAQADSALHVTFRATPDNCVQGTANGTFDMELWNHANTTKLDEVLGVTPSSGQWNACFTLDFPSSGKRLKARSDTLSGTVSFTIPTLSVDTDRITDVVKGTAPASHQVKVRLYDCNHLDFACVRKVTRTVNINGAGHYSTDMSSGFNARGFDQARVTYTNSAGHSFMVTGTFDWMAVAPADDFAFGQTHPGRKVTLTLRSSPGGTVLSKKSRTPQFGEFSVTFGAETSTGREVTGDFASDAKLKIPSTHISTDVVGSDVTLHARCLPGRKMMIDFNPGPDTIVVADSQGKADVTVAIAAWDPSTTGVNVICQSAVGDVITRRYDPPVN